MERDQASPKPPGLALVAAPEVRGNTWTSFYRYRARSSPSKGVDLWASCVIEVINLAQKVSINERNCCPVLRNLATCLLGQFSSFLRFYANPKNIFHAFVEKILEPLLELLVLLNSQVNSNKTTQAGEILRIVEDVLSNGLFHPQHLSGYFGLKSLTKTSAAKDIKGSYHRHLFERFKGIKADNKAVLLAGFGYLLQLFVSRVRNQKTAFASSGALSWLQRGSGDSDESQQHREPLFEVFMQFMEPLVLECKSYSQKEFSKLGVTRLVEVHCMLKSINVMLKTAIEEKIYVPTEDTSEGSYLNFLQDIYTFLISISEMMYEFWVSALHFEDASIKKILPLMFAEVTAAVGHFLEIEYKVLGDDLVKLWLMIFALSAVNASSKDIKPCFLLASKISSLSSQMICTFSELRQVSRSIFKLCYAVRTFGTGGPGVVQGSFSVASLSSEKCLASLTTLLSDETLMGAIRASIKSMPEGQSSRCIDELTLDLTETLKWTKGRSSEYDLKEPGESLSSGRKPIFYQKAELLGRHLSELYASVLESVTVTSSNSTLVGKSVGRDLVTLIGRLRHSNILLKMLHSNLVTRIQETLNLEGDLQSRGHTTDQFYDELCKALLKNLSSSFCRALKKSVSSFVNDSDEDSALLNSAPDLKKIISNLENGKLIDKTSELFAALANVNSLFCFLDYKKQIKCSLSVSSINSKALENDDHTFDTLENPALEYVKSMADLLEKTTAGMPELYCENGFVKIDVAMDAWEKYVKKDSDIPAHSNRTSGVSCGSHAFDMSKIQSVENILLENLLKGECPLIAFTLREVYNVSAAIVKLHGTLSFSCDDSGQTCSPVRQLSFGSLFETAFVSLQKIADMSSWPHMSSLVWIDGILRYLEVLGSSFTLPGLNIPLEVYTQIVSAHLKAIGKCILLQGKNATLPTHEIGSSTKTLQLQNASGYVFPKVLIDRQNRLKSLKSRLRLLLKKIVNIASNNHLNAALQVIERALVGVNQYSHSIYEIYTGNPDGGAISSNVAAGIDCLYLFLEFVPDSKMVNMAGYFAWNMEEAVKCASFFRRIYEEMRQQREILGKYSLHFLAGYISMFSGQGPFQTGITREIDEALRPGVYSLIDICEESDFQQLHTYLGGS
ncbi:hypothetical protein PR202_ga26692 [Eleusine coracana subsp. coracana]|uniref:Nucleolar 27S pre-rRNA processing Urb2/Npa2 C-terminal domain-containing protein n=1 Tax=Eleusine coracana subsp. coracana TaxID=191504 RepID=A0AAV5DD98_ELECO|nr:hypothetical protein PR202_ga26692 [Eleusine coracana subsp. coracana]